MTTHPAEPVGHEAERGTKAVDTTSMIAHATDDGIAEGTRDTTAVETTETTVNTEKTALTGLLMGVDCSLLNF